MKPALRQFLESFHALSLSEKHEAAVEVLRWMQQDAQGMLPEEGLVEVADQLFRELDGYEAADVHDSGRQGFRR